MPRTKQKASTFTAAQKTPKRSEHPKSSSESSEKKADIVDEVVEPVKKKRRWKAGTRAVSKIKKYQKSTDMLVPKASFQRLVREIANKYRSDLRFQQSAMLSIQEAAETYLVRVLENANLVAIEGAGRQTVYKSDMKLAQKIMKSVMKD